MKDKIVEYLDQDGHWLPRSVICEALGLKNLLEVERMCYELSKKGVIRSNVNKILGCRVFRSINDKKPKQMRCPACGSLLKKVNECYNPVCNVKISPKALQS